MSKMQAFVRSMRKLRKWMTAPEVAHELVLPLPEVRYYLSKAASSGLLERRSLPPDERQCGARVEYRAPVGSKVHLSRLASEVKALRAQNEQLSAKLAQVRRLLGDG